jgi:uncharacterized protein with PIN domain
MKFIADVMLGSLAKRLRLLGFDVLYDRTLNDNEIIRLSLAQNRMILTRDTALAARPLAANHLLLTVDRVEEQMDQVLSTFPHEMTDAPLTRCSVCNEALVPVSREDAIDLVPPHIYEKNAEFMQCSACGRTYWRGSHVKNMMLPAEKKKAGLP